MTKNIFFPLLCKPVSFSRQRVDTNVFSSLSGKIIRRKVIQMKHANFFDQSISPSNFLSYISVEAEANRKCKAQIKAQEYRLHLYKTQEEQWDFLSILILSTTSAPSLLCKLRCLAVFLLNLFSLTYVFDIQNTFTLVCPPKNGVCVSFSFICWVKVNVK